MFAGKFHTKIWPLDSDEYVGGDSSMMAEFCLLLELDHSLDFLSANQGPSSCHHSLPYSGFSPLGIRNFDRRVEHSAIPHYLVTMKT